MGGASVYVNVTQRFYKVGMCLLHACFEMQQCGRWKSEMWVKRMVELVDDFQDRREEKVVLILEGGCLNCKRNGRKKNSVVQQS